MTDPWTAAFAEHRPALFGVAYRITGTVADAEDVLQEAWIACSAAAASVDDHVAYAVRAVSRRALNRRRDISRRREEYVGPWLPEPVATEAGPEAIAHTAEGLTMALLVMMERMTPRERAAFVLCEVFDMSAPEVAHVLDTTAPAVRQLTRRARARLGNAGPAAQAAEHDRVTAEFVDAFSAGDVGRVMAVIAPDVVFTSDGGGRAVAARVPVEGAQRVVEMLLAFARNAPDAVARPMRINGRTGLLVESAAAGPSVYQFGVQDGRIHHIWVTRNPEKLTGVPGLV